MDRIDRKGVERNDRLGRHRWVVARTHGWLAAFDKLRIRYEGLSDPLVDALLQVVRDVIDNRCVGARYDTVKQD